MKFSITIPAYKSFYLNEAIRSVKEQSCEEWELIIVDDCSPEDLYSIVRPYLSDPRIQYHRNNQNCGALNVVDNWNICLSYCSGDYVICMGDDDRLLPCCLEEYIKIMEIHPNLNVYHAHTQIINGTGQVIESQDKRPEYETCQEMLYRQWKYGRKQFLGDFLFSREWLNKNGGYVKFPYGLSSDRTTANLAAKDGGIANGNKTMYEYRDTQMTISRSQDLRIAVISCNSAYKWYSENFNGILPLEFHGYYTSKLTDLIYLDVKRKPFRESIFWLSHSTELVITLPQIITTCCRGIIASAKYKKNT